jgi:succinate-acetate transporter protein
MEARSVPREADVAPATADVAPGWTPADPGPLGLAAFALTTFVLSMINSNLVSATATPVVLGVALAYGGIAQLIAGIWEFRTGNTFGAVAFCSFGAFWISFYILVHIAAAGIPAAEVGSAVGLFLWAWAIFSALMFVVSLRTTGAVALVFLLLTITLIVLGIGNSGASSGTIHLGGYLGLLTAIAAWYTALAGLLTGVWGRAVLPVFPLSG